MAWYYSLLIGVVLALLPTFLRNTFGSWFRSENYYLHNYQELAKLYGPQDPYLLVNKRGFERKMTLKQRRIFQWRMAGKFAFSDFKLGFGLDLSSKEKDHNKYRLVPAVSREKAQAYYRKFLFPVNIGWKESLKSTRTILFMLWGILNLFLIILFIGAVSRFIDTPSDGKNLAQIVFSLIMVILEVFIFYVSYSTEAIHLYVHHGYLNEETFLQNDFTFLAKTDPSFRQKYQLDNLQQHTCFLTPTSTNMSARETEVNLWKTKRDFWFLSLAIFVVFIIL